MLSTFVTQLIIPFSSTICTWEAIILESFKETLESVIMLVAEVVLMFTNTSIYILQLASRVRLGESIADGWEGSMYYVNIAAVFILLAIALANALQLNLETYQIKKTLPSLIAGLILANFSLIICKAILDFTDIIVYELISTSDTGYTLGEGLVAFILGQDPSLFASGDLDGTKLLDSIGTALGIGLSVGGAPGALVSLIAGLIFLFIPTMILLFLSLLSLARIVIIYILVVIAPLGVIALFFPPTKNLGQKWMDGFIQWAFMAPVIFFVLRLTTYFGAGASSAIDSGSFTEGAEKYLSNWLQYLAGIAILLAALIVPFMINGLGSQIMSFAKKILTDYAPNALQLKEKATGIAHMPIKIGGKDFNMLGKVLGKKGLDRQIHSKEKENRVKARQLSTALAAKHTDPERIKVQKSVIRSLVKDADEPFKDESSETLAHKIRTHPNLQAYKDGTLTDGEKYKELAGMNKELAQRANNQFHPGYATADSFMKKDWALYNKDFLATPEPKKFKESDYDANSFLLSKYYKTDSIHDAIQANDKTLLRSLDGGSVADTEKKIQKDINIHYNYKKAPADTPKSLESLVGKFKTEVDLNSKLDASKLASVHHNKFGNADLQNLESELATGNKNRTINRFKEIGFDESYIKKIDALETDKDGNFAPTLNNYKIQQSLKKMRQANTNTNSEILDTSGTNPTLKINMSTVSTAGLSKNDPEYIIKQNIVNKRDNISIQGDFSTIKSSLASDPNDLKIKMKTFLEKSSNETKTKFFGNDSKILKSMTDSKKSVAEKMKDIEASTKKDDYLRDLIIFT